MTPLQRELQEQAERQRELVSEWLLSLMRQSTQKPATKDVLRQIAIDNFQVSKSAFDAGWNFAIMTSGCH